MKILKNDIITVSAENWVGKGYVVYDIALIESNGYYIVAVNDDLDEQPFHKNITMERLSDFSIAEKVYQSYKESVSK